MRRDHDDDDDTDPLDYALSHDPDAPAQSDFLERFGDAYEVVKTTTTIRRGPRRAGRRRVDDAPSDSTLAGAATAPSLPSLRPALPAPATPHPDPIPHVMPHGSISTLSGASGVGKTALLAGWIRAWQSGGAINTHQVNQPVAIGMLAVDRPWRDHRQWFAKAGCAPFPYYALRDDDTVDWNAFRDWKRVAVLFAQHVDRVNLPPGALLIVDPLPLYIPGDLNKYKDVAIGLAQLDKVLQARQLTMLGVFHVSKQKGNPKDNYLRPQDRILGSGGQIGYSETAMYLLSPEEGNKPYYEVGWIPHQIKAETFALQRDDRGLFVPVDPIDSLIVQARNEDKALDCFPFDEEVTLAVVLPLICTACGVKERQARALVTELVAHFRLTRITPGRYKRNRPH